MEETQIQEYINITKTIVSKYIIKSVFFYYYNIRLIKTLLLFIILHHHNGPFITVTLILRSYD